MNKIWPCTLIGIIIFISTNQIGSGATTSTTKTYQDLGLGFRIVYPSNLVLNKSSDNITLSNPELLKNASNYFKSTISVDTWVKEIGLSGMFTPPNLDTLARHVALGISGINGTVTNKSKFTLDNSTAYLVRFNKTFSSSHTVYGSEYLTLKGDLAYSLLFTYSDQAKFLPVEQMVVKSFRFV